MKLWDGVENKDRFVDLVSNIQSIANQPRHVVGASSHYMALQMEFWAGVTPTVIPYLSTYFTGMQVASNASRHEVHVSSHFSCLNCALEVAYTSFADREATHSWLCTFTFASASFEQFMTYLSNLDSWLHIPYYTETVQFWEVYSAAVPIYTPSLSLLTTWRRDRIPIES